jgi:hypothetical protein
MARDKNTFNAKVDPINWKIWEVYPPIFLPLVYMRLEDKTIHAITLAKETLVILAIVFIGNA